VRREPAPYAFVLEIGVEAVGELLVLARIADEAGEELDRLVQQRGQVVYQVVWQADTAQEGQGQWARALQGSVVDDAWPLFGVMSGQQNNFCDMACDLCRADDTGVCRTLSRGSASP
jgi:hypothetical protein